MYAIYMVRGRHQTSYVCAARSAVHAEVLCLRIARHRGCRVVKTVRIG